MKRIFFFTVAIACSTAAWSQHTPNHNWLFGNSNKWIEFGRPFFVPSTLDRPAITYGTGGGAVATDAATGNLLFYTDGDNVYDVTHTLMPNSGLGGTTAINQPAVICPVPGTPDQYFVFTITAAGTVEQAIVNVAVSGNAIPPALPMGDVISKNAGTGLSNRSEGMIIIPKVNGDESWLITHEANSDNYTVTSVTAGGLSHNTFTGNGVSLTVANFSFHDNNDGTGKIAVAPKDANTNVVIFDFDRTGGTLTFNTALSALLFGTGTPSNIAETIYDTEWSITGDTLYISKHGDPSTGVGVSPPEIVQAVLTPPATTPLSILPAGLDIVRSYGLQKGSDTLIYHLYENSLGQLVVGSIEDTDRSGPNQVTYTPVAFSNGGSAINFNAKQFPSFSPTAKAGFTLTFVYTGTPCTNSPITFFPTIAPTADYIEWNYGDGSPPEISWAPIHTFASANATVTATAYVNGQPVAVAQQNLTLIQFDVTLGLQPRNTACSCELTNPRIVVPRCTDFQIDANPSGGSATYQWFGPEGLIPGETSSVLTPVATAGNYYVVATQGSCNVSAAQRVQEYHVQDQSAFVWHFGNQAGIDFNGPTENPPRPVEAIIGPVNSNEGVAIQSDQNGKVIISTDGYQVYDRNGDPLVPTAPPAPVTPIAAQSTMIMQAGNDPTLYYIFTADPIENGMHRVTYMLFDLKDLSKGTIGAIVDPDNDPSTDPRITLYTTSTERLTGNNAGWLILHEYDNNTFRAFRVTDTGIQRPVVTDIGSEHSSTSTNTARGYMKLNGNLLVVALNDGVSNTIEVFDFDNATGALSNFRKINLNEPVGQIYGVEIAGTSKIFATVSDGNVSTIHEFGIDPTTGALSFLQKTAPIAEDLGALQNLNGQIYVASNGASYLYYFTPDGTMTPPTPSASLNALQQFTLLSPSTSTLGLPNFVGGSGSNVGGPAWNAPTEGCPNTELLFSAIPSDEFRDEFSWTLKDPGGATIATSTTESLQYTFVTPGVYEISLIITSDCMIGNIVASFSQPVTIHPPPATPTFLLPGDDNLICTPPKQLRATPNPAGLSFLWNTTETTNDISITQAGTYSVTITDVATTCTSSGSIAIFDNRPVVDLGPDFPMCSNASVTLDSRVAQNQAGTIQYSWTDGANTGSNQQFTIDNTVLGIHTVNLTVTDLANSCSSSDVVEVTVNPIPTFTSNVLVNPGCTLSNGEVQINITTAGDYTVNFTSATVNEVRNNQVMGPVTPTFQNLSADTYSVLVTNTLTGCVAPGAVGLSNSNFSVNVNYTTSSCTPVTVLVQRNGTGTGVLTYNFTNKSTGQVLGPFTNNTGADFTTSAVPPGGYVLEITDGAGCVTTEDIDITPLAPTAFTLNYSCNTITVALAAGNVTPANATYSWTGPAGSIVAGTETSQQVSINPGSWNNISVTVGDNSGAHCPTTQTTSATAGNLAPTFTSTDLCQPPVQLIATPTGTNFVYAWTLNGAPIGGGQSITITTDGLYALNVADNSTGCNANAPSQNITLPGSLSVQLSSTTPCAGQQFSITATITPTTGTSLQWQLNNNNISTVNENPLVDSRPGTYKAIVTLNGCAPVEMSMPISPVPLPPLLLPSTMPICDNTFKLNAGLPSNTYQWYQNGILQAETSNEFEVSERGSYSVDITNAAGCTASDKTEVIRNCKPEIEAPTAFRPGSSNNPNKIFKVFENPHVSTEDFQIFIFNRWGEMVYQNTDLNFQWDGKDGRTGILLPPGVYSWVAKYKGVDKAQQEIREKRGGVLLIR